MSESFAIAGGRAGRGIVDITDDLSCLDSGDEWLVVGYFEGPVLALKFEQWMPAESLTSAVPARWSGARDWQSHTSQAEYEAAVETTRQRIAAGDVYQANICRLISTEWPEQSTIAGLHSLLQKHNPAPMSALVNVVDSRLQRWGIESLEIASASPEIFLVRNGQIISSSPIKGTAPVDQDFLQKDNSENIMIVDLVRNDLSQVCDIASVEVPHLLQPQSHPGLVHLVSTVQGQLRDGVSWSDIFDATFPPGSVSGAPKSSALTIIKELEKPRGIYCGTIGVVNAKQQTASLSVAIRTFWKSNNRLWFGTGSGITWGSTPSGEWEETQLKARHLISVAAMSLEGEVL
jgi:para-aminobenzoate synthetase component 1